MLLPLSDGKPATAPVPVRRAALPSPARGAHAATRSLTPQFHWNLNDSAVRCLSDDDRASLYALFRFYDSSFTGDALPAIHLPRLLELLRDAQLLATDDDANGDADDELQLHTVERVFAQAVLGKLRTYLDAADEPALTFPLFCGALFHCATLKFPELAPPETAYRRLLSAVLTLQPRGGTYGRDVSHGLAHHAEHAAIPSWSVHSLHGDLRATTTSDVPVVSPRATRKLFLERQVYQQVVATLSLDKLVDEQRRERLVQLYDVPEELTTHFNAETVRYITDRFRTFDVFDKGVLPRDEVFALLSGMAKKLEITDVYEVLAVILAGEFGDRTHLPRGSLVLSAPSSVKQVSLTQVFQALHVCRRARTASYLLSQQQQNANARKVGGVAAAQAKQAQSTGSDAGTASGPNTKTTGKKVAGHGHRPGKASDKKPARGKAGAGSGSGPQHKQVSPTKGTGKAATTTATLPQATAATTTTSAKRTTKKDKKASTADAGLLRRLSKMSASSSEVSTLPVVTVHETDDAALPSIDADGVTRQDSFRSASSASSTIKVPTGLDVASRPKVRDPSVSGVPTTIVHDETDDRDKLDVLVHQHTLPPQPALSETVDAALTLRLFHSHSGETKPTDPHGASRDGAICLTLALFLTPPPRRIVSAQGVYFASSSNPLRDRFDVWATETTVLDDNRPLEAAVVALKKLVDEYERVGFALAPEHEQREAIDALLRAIRDAKCPRYAAARQSPKKSKQATATIAKKYESPTSRLLAAERSGTHVRDNLSTKLSDPQLQRDLEQQKQRVLLADTHNGSRRRPRVMEYDPLEHESRATSPSRAAYRLCELPREPTDIQIARCLAFDAATPPGAWVAALNPVPHEPTRGRLVSSHSLPVLVQRPRDTNATG